MRRILKQNIKLVHKSFASIKSAYVPKGWTKLTAEDKVEFVFDDKYDQHKFVLAILSNFAMQASYYGWAVPHDNYIRQMAASQNTVCELLKSIETCCICPGTDADDGMPHYVTRVCDFQKDTTIASEVTLLTKR